MNKEYVKAIEAAEKFNLYLKVVTSIQSFDNYNSFFNIFSQEDKPCRRIVVLTPYEELEEVYDEKLDEEIIDEKIIHKNIWLKEFPLTINPKNIDLNEMVVSKKILDEYSKAYLN